MCHSNIFILLPARKKESQGKEDARNVVGQWQESLRATASGDSE